MSAALLTGTPLSGRVAVVSGASSGMGAVTAERLAELGATVVVLARRKERLDSLVKNIEAAGGTALALAVDVTDPDASRLMADLIHDIDVLQSADIAETVAFMAAVPRHVNLTEITILPTAQAI